MRRTEAIAAAAVTLAGLGAAVLVGTARLVRHHVRSEPTSSGEAGLEMDRVLAHFPRQAPLRVIRDGQEPLRARAPTIIGDPTHFLHALLFDARSGRVVRADLPLRLLRILKTEGFRYVGELTPLQSDTEFERDRIDLPLSEIVAHGPLLVVDHSHPSGARLVAWVD
jgi:hypothetical protein